MLTDKDQICLVTGATGLIGRRVVDRLSARGRPVLAAGRTSAAFEENKQVSYYSLDLHDRAAVTDLIARYKPRQLIHLAWEATPGIFWQSRENFRWISASAHLLDRFVAEGGQRALLTGSCAEYGWGQTPLHERDSPLDPRSYYSASKIAFHDLARVIARDTELVWARVFFPYGPEEDSSKLISHTLREISADRLPEFKTPGRAVDFIHLSDVARYFDQLLTSSVTGPVNICSGIALRPPEIAAAAARLLGKPDLAAALDEQLTNMDGELTIVGDRQILDQVLTQTAQTQKIQTQTLSSAAKQAETLRPLNIDEGLRSYLRIDS
ncbi:NAD-dependent epimerase/dehydratase family protein [Sneathiella marina]|uniref:NAD-dependent epimerase/dehydratase family protein n=1 Tax=Sneathiella marina TaxID=2950108 RepID=A0ABY4VZH6_9PROT|nr:NAD-dependent epimerase/dehydratase family protein [Sneathiella marina]USG60342.1 NAD-dependent epimerase/dehydratase family protein [Sneathiella marina]